MFLLCEGKAFSPWAHPIPLKVILIHINLRTPQISTLAMCACLKYEKFRFKMKLISFPRIHMFMLLASDFLIKYYDDLMKS